MSDDFAKIMRDNDMGETLKEVKNAFENKDMAPRAPKGGVNDAADVGGFTPPNAYETGVSNTSVLKLVGVAVLVTAVIIALVMLGK
ncbi:MAG: hypothetical protein LBC50_00880 [Candidatus Ancillula sp.]|jgi:hypothetical protein|nr:hypothetical protein [Candidatus Ancillula sp.]